MWDQEKYQKAIAFAGYAHRKQSVPGQEYNYVVHLSNVAAEIARAMFAENIGDGDLTIQCALLHDIIEDTDTGPEEIRKEFGENVLNGILALTKSKELDKEKQMTDSLKRIRLSGREIACVKMADRISNLQRPPETWGNNKRKRYLDEANIIWEELKEYSEFLSSRLQLKIKEYENYIDTRKIP